MFSIVQDIQDDGIITEKIFYFMEKNMIKAKLITVFAMVGCVSCSVQSNGASGVNGRRSGYAGKTYSVDTVPVIMTDGTTLLVQQTEMTQKLYTEVMGENPSRFKGGKHRNQRPVEHVSWYDAIYFCNKLSKRDGLTPVYAVNNETDVEKWGYTPHEGNPFFYAYGQHTGGGMLGTILQLLSYEENENEDNLIYDGITQDESADGYRLPTVKEWEYAAKGRENYKYAGSNRIGEVAWYSRNSFFRPHPVAQKKPNGYGLYDMSGNVREWCWNSFGIDGGGDWKDYHDVCGGSYKDCADLCKNWGLGLFWGTKSQEGNIGFRVVRRAK